MPAVTLRLVLSLAAASAVAVLAACAGSSDDGSTTNAENALTAADDARFDALLLDAFATSTATNFRSAEGDRTCYAGSPTTKVYGWDALGGQWFAPALRANLRTRQLADELTVIQVPTGQANVVDVMFLGTPTDLDGAAPSLCAARTAEPDAATDASLGPAPTGNLKVLLTCKGVTMTDVTTTIPAALCSH